MKLNGRNEQDFDERARVDMPSPHERLLELTALLALGIHRLRNQCSVSPESIQAFAESSLNNLDSVPEPCPDGTVSTRERGAK